MTGGYISQKLGDTETLGVDAAGTFTQSGGTNAASSLVLGANSRARIVYPEWQRPAFGFC